MQGFIDVLVAAARHDSIPADQDIYAPMLGNWDIDGTEYVTTPPTPVKIKVSFARTLQGRAIQDVWSWPHGSGTTLRVYDPEEGVWRVTWIDPVKRNRVHLDARKVGADIVQIGANAKGEARRWIFSEIQPDSFTWRGDGSNDGGQTWRLYAEYFARRRR